MADAPSGTLTLLFTDIEGLDEAASTRRSLRELWRITATCCALVRLASWLRGRHRGRRILRGLSFCKGCAAAAAAAREHLQTLLVRRQRSRVRMGLHTARATSIQSGIRRSLCASTARVMGAGHGRQVLLEVGQANWAMTRPFSFRPAPPKGPSPARTSLSARDRGLPFEFPMLNAREPTDETGRIQTDDRARQGASRDLASSPR